MSELRAVGVARGSSPDGNGEDSSGRGVGDTALFSEGVREGKGSSGRGVVGSDLLSERPEIDKDSVGDLSVDCSRSLGRGVRSVWSEMLEETAGEDEGGLTNRLSAMN